MRPRPYDAVVGDRSNAEMRAHVEAIVTRMNDDPENATSGWSEINADVFRHFPAVRGAGRGAHGLGVMLPEPDPDLERRIRDRYGEQTTFMYGNAYAVGTTE